MNFHFQDPTIPFSLSLHEALLQACSGALCGGGAYAFVSQDGVRLLLEDDTFRNFVEQGSFKLVVGIDQITNENTLQKLRALRDSYKGLEIEAFLHNISGSLFHPKFTWFKNKHGGVLIVGSGNLTSRGLRSNWEAYGIVQLDKKDLRRVEKNWEQWLVHSAGNLKSIDDTEVVEKAKLNIWGKRKKKDADKEEIIDEDIKAWIVNETEDYLVAEIPRGDRWKQANFDVTTFKEFFGAIPGDNSQRILLRNVEDDGTLGEIESRPSISVKSQNYRFELGAAGDLQYPEGKLRPIGIFLRISARMFLYVLALPTDGYYTEVKKFLDQNDKGEGREGSMKRVRGSVPELKELISELPFSKIDIDEENIDVGSK